MAWIESRRELHRVYWNTRGPEARPAAGPAEDSRELPGTGPGASHR